MKWISICDQRSHLGVGRKSCAAIERGKLDDEINVDFLRIKAFHKLIGSRHCATGSEHVVVEHHDIVGADSVAMNFDDIGTIFLCILLANSIGGELTGFAARHETGTEFECEDRTSDETTRFNAYDFGNTFIAVELRKIPADDMECTGIFKSCGKILEEDSFAGEILNVADFGLDVFH